ncbi:MAG: hypothetical protein EBS39_00010 [Gammaproteobacteria bacterium]|nr:hypothetical protein [Gammaproteobacteria bacterium]
MKMQKYTAPDMRSALRMVRTEHGPDALILWTRRAAGVVELTVATDPEAAVHAGTLAPALQVVGGEPLPARSMPAASRGEPPPVVTAMPPSVPEPSSRVESVVTPVIPEVRAPSRGTVTAMAAEAGIDGELKALRRLLETQLAALAWNDLTRRSPVIAELMRLLAALGVDRALAARLLDSVPATDDLGFARRMVLDGLQAEIPTLGDAWTEQGGTLVLTGPAGSGKTNALAALAARWVLRHGPSGAALVSAGETRLGAFEHLARLGRLLGVPTYQIGDVAELPELMKRLQDHRLVLVDTPAPGGRGEDIEAYGRGLAALRGIATVAVALPATLQATALRALAARHARWGATACILTRLDEALSLGGAISAVIGHRLPVAYVTEGTSLTDDLRPARGEELVERAVALVERHGTTADEDLLTRRMEGRLDVAS